MPMKLGAAPLTPIVLILVTPSLVALAEEDHPVIPNLLRRIFGWEHHVQKVDVLLAVVDRISYPPGNIVESLGITQETTPHGSEGLSILVADSAQVCPDLWSAEPQVYEQWDRLKEQQSFLSFQLFSNSQSSARMTGKPYTIHTVELPLANTIFQNGETSTIAAQRWLCNREKTNEPDIVRIKHSRVRHHVLALRAGELPCGGNRSAKVIVENCVRVPNFHELTPPRTVSEAMGNIVRRLNSGCSADSAMSASEELERSIASWTPSAENIYEIWARITPQERWSGLPQVIGLPSEIEQGSRLHRVLSGGGGWGNKQGLISLDPESSISRSSKQFVFRHGQDLGAEQREALGEVVRPGDVIQFYVFEQPKSPPFGKKQQTHAHVVAPFSISFGNMQSQKDTMPRDPTPEDAQQNVRVVHGHFGALSEAGISLRIQLALNTTSSYGTQTMGTIVQTKLPPLSSFARTIKES